MGGGKETQTIILMGNKCWCLCCIIDLVLLFIFMYKPAVSSMIFTSKETELYTMNCEYPGRDSQAAIHSWFLLGVWCMLGLRLWLLPVYLLFVWNFFNKANSYWLQHVERGLHKRGRARRIKHASVCFLHGII